MESETLLESYRFEKYILDLAIMTLEQGGVTSNVSTRQLLPPIDAWGVPKFPEKTLILPQGACLASSLKAFIELNHVHLATPESWLGTWINPFTRCCHLDITEIYRDLDEARREALKRNQVLALYNFKHNQTIYLHSESVISEGGYLMEKV